MENILSDIKEELKSLSCCIIIPTYNNDTTISNVVSKAKDYSYDVFVVNDGSTDSTREILHSFTDIHIIDYNENKGKGFALITGLKEAHKSGFKYAITLDSDGQHFFEDIPAFISKIKENPEAMIIGIRNVSTQENMPQKNTFANKFSNFWFKVETNLNMADTQCGFRLYPLEKITNKHYFTKRYDFELEVLVRAAWDDVKIIEQPIKVFYAPKGERVSHFKPLRDFTRISILNTILVLIAFLWIKPRDFFRNFTKENIKKFFQENFFNSKESNARLASAVGFGFFMGVIPIWGYQMIIAYAIASFLKINKWIVLVASNISLPFFIPFLLLGSYATGGIILGNNVFPTLQEMTIDFVMSNLYQYLIGSIVFAIILGFVGWLITFSILSIVRKK